MRFNQLRILADENISPRVVLFLRKQGLDVVDVKENGWQGKEDKYLLEQAYLDKRFVLTHDSDFATLVIHQAKKCYDIVYLRLKNLQFHNVIKVCDELLQLEQELFVGCLIVVKESHIRIRQQNL